MDEFDKNQVPTVPSVVCVRVSAPEFAAGLGLCLTLSQGGCTTPTPPHSSLSPGLCSLLESHLGQGAHPRALTACRNACPTPRHSAASHLVQEHMSAPVSPVPV